MKKTNFSKDDFICKNIFMRQTFDDGVKTERFNVGKYLYKKIIL